MIKIINSNTNEEHIVIPTMFPDRTSQIWKLPEQFVQKNVLYKIIWEFENEGELIHVAQLAKLLVATSFVYPTLGIPYLPYGRQDKKITNESTFALKAFMMLIRQIEVDNIYTLDAHNKNEIYPIINMNVNKEIKFAIDSTECHFVCFPDKGASQRGYDIQNKHFFCLEKIRNQLTGNIEGLKLENDLYNLKNKSVLIVDDICDGGRTFIEAAKLLYNEGVKEVSLYITHGLFTKGLQVLRDAGIKRIFTYEGEMT